MVWTFAAATIASVTALIIAFVAYPWQKQRDRALQLHSERRKALVRFFSAYDQCAIAIKNEQSDVIGTALLAMGSSINELRIVGDSSSAEACLIASSSLSNWLSANLGPDASVEAKELEETARYTKEKALEVARLSLHGLAWTDYRELFDSVRRNAAKGTP